MIILEILAVLACTLFAGAAIYINIAEHPARLSCGTELAATVFGPSYNRAATMQVSLALIATISGIVIWATTGGLLWITGSILIFSVIPFTFAAIMPTNKILLDPQIDRASEETRALLVKWGKLHFVRSILSGIASLAFLYEVVAT